MTKTHKWYGFEGLLDVSINVVELAYELEGGSGAKGEVSSGAGVCDWSREGGAKGGGHPEGENVVMGEGWGGTRVGMGRDGEGVFRVLGFKGFSRRLEG